MNNDDTLRTYHYFTSNLNATAKGVVVSSLILKSNGKHKSSYHEITYTYEVQGQQYSSNLFSFKERSDGNSHEVIKEYPRGKEVLVWHDRDSPEIGVLKKSGPTPGLIFITLAGILFSCLGFFLNPLMWIAFGDKYRENRYQR